MGMGKYHVTLSQYYNGVTGGHRWSQSQCDPGRVSA